jgi:hypothetical protein
MQRTINRRSSRFLAGVVLLLMGHQVVVAADAGTVQGLATSAVDAKLYYESDIRPIMKAHCFHCHGEDGEIKGKVDLRLVRLMRKAEIIDDHNVADSTLLAVCVSGDMPKEGKPLPAHDLEKIRRWLLQGAPTKRPEPETVPDFYITDTEAEHWAFQPVQSITVPVSTHVNPIDAFIEEKLSALKLSFAPQADRVTLIRRASYDLLGLPPTPEEIAAFIADDSPQAWEHVINRLLASPAYGERWGRHWLDVVGYADSYGGPKDTERTHAWHYRDYVVRSLNADKPWDQFIREQVAGDELAGITATQANQVIGDKAYSYCGFGKANVSA